jgi:hypothetical protein
MFMINTTTDANNTMIAYFIALPRAMVGSLASARRDQRKMTDIDLDETWQVTRLDLHGPGVRP